MLKVITLFSAVILAGCAGGPVGWGGTHKVLFKNDSAITIQYDAIIESRSDVDKIAANHCNKYSKTAKVSNIHADSLTFGLVKTISFSCDKA